MVTGDRPFTRRQFVSLSLALAADLAARRALAGQQPGGEQFLGTIPLSAPRAAPLNRLLATGLDARLFTDLSGLRADSLLTPNDRFYVRTACPDAARTANGWKIRIGGLVSRPVDVAAEDLARQAEDLGICLLECSGNSDPDNFGLISAAAWQGVRLGRVLAGIDALPAATHVRISGLDHDRSPMGTSVPGASWVFARDQLRDAFLATGMNGRALSPDHGAPVRLVVPGWYGCVAIKWVNAIEFAGDDAPPTSQMVEFAERTHQRGMPALARDYLPATIDHAAVPVRIEHWSSAGRPVYRIVGIQWGGETPSDALEIKLGGGVPFVGVTNCPLPASTRTWSLWMHEWRPAAPGRYALSMRFSDPAFQTRRLDMDFYRRVVTIPAA